MLSRTRVVLAGVVGVLGTAGCLRVAECQKDADCKGDQYCDTNTHKCQAGTSSSSSSSSGGVGSSSGPPSSSNPPACPEQCSTLAHSNTVTQWSCANGGPQLSDCRIAACANGRANCDDGGVTCEVDLAADPAHCGACGNAIHGVGSMCADGGILCGSGPACTGSNRCVQDSQGGVYVCCGPDEASCNGACVNIKTSVEHCGGCHQPVGSKGNACVNGRPACGSAAACTDNAVCKDSKPTSGTWLCCSATEENCGSCVNLQESEEHCGSCGNGQAGHPGASQCVSGQWKCGTNTGECEHGTPKCDPTGTGACYQCLLDQDCGATEVCCGGTCKAKSAACGCGTRLGTVDGESCSAAGAGALCIGLTGLPLSDDSEQSKFHAGVCGCEVVAGAAKASQCDRYGNLPDLCGVNPDAEQAGLCVKEADPPRNGTQGAGNCGAVGTTCDPSKGGYNCVPPGDGGVGMCACDHLSTAFPADGCLTPLLENGREHVVADSCARKTLFGGSNDQCRCTTSAACDPAGPNPDCCESGCVNLETSLMNCGLCGTTCLGEPVCGNADAGLAPGQCGCGEMGCPWGGGGGGNHCDPSGGCVCLQALLAACPVGYQCNEWAPLGCCLKAESEFPNTCMPGATGSTCAKDPTKPNRRECYKSETEKTCCDQGCGVYPNACLPGTIGSACPTDPNKPNKRLCLKSETEQSCCDNGCLPDGTCVE